VLRYDEANASRLQDSVDICDKLARRRVGLDAVGLLPRFVRRNDYWEFQPRKGLSVERIGVARDSLCGHKRQREDQRRQ
jgi:hypothetical protein